VAEPAPTESVAATPETLPAKRRPLLRAAQMVSVAAALDLPGGSHVPKSV
jgi:hypothetical protein